MVNRQRIDECAEAQTGCPLRNGRKEHARRWRHAERSEVVLGNVISVEIEPVERLYDFQAMLVILMQRQVVSIQVIEHSKFQTHSGVTIQCASASLVDA